MCLTGQGESFGYNMCSAGQGDFWLCVLGRARRDFWLCVFGSAG